LYELLSVLIFNFHDVFVVPNLYNTRIKYTPEIGMALEVLSYYYAPHQDLIVFSLETVHNVKCRRSLTSSMDKTATNAITADRINAS